MFVKPKSRKNAEAFIVTGIEVLYSQRDPTLPILTPLRQCDALRSEFEISRDDIYHRIRTVYPKNGDQIVQWCTNILPLSECADLAFFEWLWRTTIKWMCTAEMNPAYIQAIKGQFKQSRRDVETFVMPVGDIEKAFLDALESDMDKAVVQALRRRRPVRHIT